MGVRVARIAPIESSSSTVRKLIDTGSQELLPRQPYAAAVFDLTDLLAGPPGSKEYMIYLNRFVFAL